jgi:chromosomal replication initiation ATPase DnaA
VISNVRLLEIFQAEFDSTRSYEAAMGAVRNAVAAQYEEARSRRAPVDPRLARRNSRGPHSDDPLTASQVREVEMAVAELFNISLMAQRSAAARVCVHARFVICAVLRRISDPPLSLPQIARALKLPGQQPHTTVLHAIRRVDALPELGNHVDRVLEVLRRRGWPVPATVGRRDKGAA